MKEIILIIVGILYFIVAVEYFLDGKSALGITFVCYALANYGIYMAGE